MSADIQKEAVYDDRIVQSPPRYAVEKGALSLTNAPFNAIASTSSQQTFNIYVPSENVFVDRALRWSGTAYFGLTAVATADWLNAASPVAAGAAPNDYIVPILTYGTDIALAPLPLNYLCQTMTATINDTTSVINSQDVLMEVMRLTNYKKNLLQRTCPTMLDKYQWNGTGLRTVNDPMAGFAEAMNVDEQPNGAFGGFFWTDPQGVPLSTLGTLNAATGQQRGSYVSGGVTVYFANGVPVVVNGATAAAAAVSFPLFFAFRSTEKLVLSPFVFADDCEDDTGLFGINNIQLIMNFKSGDALQRLIRTRSNGGPPSAATATTVPTGSAPIVTAGSLVWNSGATGGVWSSAVMNVQFLTPALDVPLPPKSVVPYMEFPRYITQQQNGIALPGPIQLQSQTITLPQIPDLLIVYVKATKANGAPDPQSTEYGDCYMPIASAFNSSTKNPLSVNFDNFSGLLSSHTTEELYQMSVSNGLQMPWNTWSGQALSENAVPAGQLQYSVNVGGTPTLVPANPYQVGGQLRSTVGGFLVLKPSKDITLQPGQAPSLVGNFTLQFNLTVVNTFGFPVTPTLYVITANSGFFESIRGSSRIIKGVLSEQDIISAPMSASQTRSGLKRLVGGLSFDSLANVFSKAKNIYEQTKPIGSAIKNLLPGEGMMGKVKGAMGAVGYGGDAMGAGGNIGAGRSRRGLSARLM
jgi:hypothetical protein